MASALQCPSCGHKHRLSGFSGEPMFRCEHCDRVLKTPEQFRRPQPERAASSSSRQGRVSRGGAANADRTATLPATAKKQAGAAPAARPRKRPVVLTAPFVLAVWVASIALSGMIVLILGRKFGWLSKDRIWDLLTGSGLGRYLRVLVIVPVWALLAAALVTVALEGLRRLARRNDAPRARPAPRLPQKPAGKPAARPREPAAAAAPRAASRPEPRPEPRVEPRPEPEPAGAPAPRPRRIPRRDVAT